MHSVKNMDLKLKIVFLFAITAANAGLVPVSPNILEGPSSKTILIGPDGSQISAVIPGGKIVLDGNAGPLLQGAPEVVESAGLAVPVIEVGLGPQAKKGIKITATDTDGASAAVVAKAAAAGNEDTSNSTEENAERELTTLADVEVTTDAAKAEPSSNSEETLALAESSSTSSTTNNI